jgi:hypothetical protein
MSLFNRTASRPDPGLSPKPRKWPAIVGLTAAVWFVLSGVLLAVLSSGPGQ